MLYYIKITSFRWMKNSRQGTAKDPTPLKIRIRWTGPNPARPITIPNFNYSRALRKLINSIATVFFFKNYPRNSGKSGGLRLMSYFNPTSTVRIFLWTCLTSGSNCIPSSTLFTKTHFPSRAPLFLITASSKNLWQGWKESSLRVT